MATSTLSLTDVKGQSAQLFKEGRYSEALELFSQVGKRDSVSYSNQALCHLKLGNWEEVILHSEEAIKINPTYIKPYFLKGRALTELDRFDAAILGLKTAHNMAREQKINFGEDIICAIRHAKKKRWASLEEARLCQQSSLENVLVDLIKDRDHKLKEYHGSAQVNKKLSVDSDQENLLGHLESVFHTEKEKNIREVPDFLCGKISFEVMTDPVITPSGITYNRQDIEDHLQRVGHFDPITRQSLTYEQLVPNLALKEVIDSFVTKNEWIEQY